MNARFEQNSIVVTSDKIIMGMSDTPRKFRVCMFSHTPTISTNWCRHTNSNLGEVSTINLDPSSTYLIAGGYIDSGVSDKIALIMRIKYSDGSDGTLNGWL